MTLPQFFVKNASKLFLHQFFNFIFFCFLIIFSIFLVFSIDIIVRSFCQSHVPWMRLLKT